MAMPSTSGSRTPAQRKKKRPQKPPGLDASLKRRFQSRLLKWYEKHGRDLPWRKTSDPYHILVSEVMLQQTQVDRVIPKYHEFLERYPSFEELAEAPVSDVKKTWYPLGYNIRPERLHSIACETVDTNVIRVLHRVFIAKGDPKAQKTKLWQLSETLIPSGKGYDFNQAIMDFGATCCTARNPSCRRCPMKSFCKVYPFDRKSRIATVRHESR